MNTKNKLFSVAIITLYFSPILAVAGVKPEAPQVNIEVAQEEVQTEDAEIPIPVPPAEEALDLNKKEDLLKFAEKKVKERFGETEWQPFYDIVQSESGWNNNAQNPHSTAYGLGQFLISTQRNYGIEGVSEPEPQLNATMDYMADRYGSPWEAYQFRNINGWY